VEGGASFFNVLLWVVLCHTFVRKQRAALKLQRAGLKLNLSKRGLTTS